MSLAYVAAPSTTSPLGDNSIQTALQPVEDFFTSSYWPYILGGAALLIVYTSIRTRRLSR